MVYYGLFLVLSLALWFILHFMVYYWFILVWEPFREPFGECFRGTFPGAFGTVEPFQEPFGEPFRGTFAGNLCGEPLRGAKDWPFAPRKGSPQRIPAKVPVRVLLANLSGQPGLV